MSAKVGTDQQIIFFSEAMSDENVSSGRLLQPNRAMGR